MMQREDHAVTVAEVKEIMDEAISHSQKANVKHLVKRVFGRSTDNSDHIILKEEDFYKERASGAFFCICRQNR